jgi:beta-lactamase regulating signal transducer with metallopeptidase domain
MIASWMWYCLLCAGGLSLAAMLVERVLVAGRAPVRMVWATAVALSVLMPFVAFRIASRPIALESSSVLSVDATSLSPDASLPPVPRVESTTAGTVSHRGWRATLARLDESLVLAWLAISIGLAFNFAGGLLTLAWMRRKWQRHSVLDVSVYVSERTGPAVVGVIAPAIVLPAWALGMEPSRLELVLRHEQEHRRAEDGRLLALAQLALIAMPWNLALWWQILRLRVAVELDCDTRVLRNADLRSYGDLLLDVAHAQRGPTLLGVTAFAERAVQLERRIHLLSRHRVRTSRKAGAVASFIGLLAVGVAWAAPVPTAPRRIVTRPVADSDASTQFSTPVIAEVQHVAPIAASAVNAVALDGSATTRAPLMTRSTRDRDVVAVNAPTLASASMLACPRAGDQEPSNVDPYYDRLFEGIVLAPEQEQEACALLLRLRIRQDAADRLAALISRANSIIVVRLQEQRDSALRALLTSDADRALFDANSERNRAGARGGSRGAVPDWSAGVRGRVVGDTVSVRVRGGARGAGGGRGGRAAGTVQGRSGTRFDVEATGVVTGPSDVLARVVSDVVFLRLFDGITLTDEQKESAQTLIEDTQRLIFEERSPLPPPILRLNSRAGTVSMPAEDAAAFLDILTDDADRELVRTRITITI